ncbi:MAG: hypothetical protein ABIZ04_17635 [Opitutus sp.]
MRRAFSLLEVVIAVAIVAGSLMVALAALPALLRQSAESADLQVAQRLPALIRLELERSAAAAGFDSLAAAIPVMGVPLQGGHPCVVTADGLRIQTGVSPTSIAAEEAYFLVELWRFNQVPLAFDAGAAVLPAYVRVSWPFHVHGDSAETPVDSRSSYCFAISLAR